jgi:hypothetical protein
MSIYRPSFIEILKFVLPNIGQTQLVYGNDIIFELMRTVNGEILVTRFDAQSHANLGWQITRDKFSEAIRALNLQAIIETHPFRDSDLLFSFAIKCNGIQAFLRRADLYLRVESRGNTTLRILELLDDLYK